MRQLMARIYHSLFRNNQKAARRLGVHFGEGCKFIGNPISMFGSEPWAITIGNDVELTNGVQIITHDGALWVARRMDDSLKQADVIRPVTIGNNVFVGVNTTILPGVTIGNNVIIGAGSVVNRDIPDNTVAVGAPARPIKDITAYITEIKQAGYKNTKQLSAVEKQKVWEKGILS